MPFPLTLGEGKRRASAAACHPTMLELSITSDPQGHPRSRPYEPGRAAAYRPKPPNEPSAREAERRPAMRGNMVMLALYGHPYVLHGEGADRALPNGTDFGPGNGRGDPR